MSAKEEFGWSRVVRFSVQPAGMKEMGRRSKAELRVLSMNMMALLWLMVRAEYEGGSKASRLTIMDVCRR